MLDRLYRMRRPLFDGEDTGGSNPIPATTAEVANTADDATHAIRHLASALEGLTPHLKRALEEGIRLHPVEVVKEIPAATADVVADTGEAAGSVVEGGTHAVSTVPAVATDTLETAQTATSDAGKVASSTTRKFRLKKRR